MWQCKESRYMEEMHKIFALRCLVGISSSPHSYLALSYTNFQHNGKNCSVVVFLTVRPVIQKVVTKLSEEPATSIVRFENGDSKLFHNSDNHIQYYMAMVFWPLNAK
jgi:hypothetical protein